MTGDSLTLTLEGEWDWTVMAILTLIRRNVKVP